MPLIVDQALASLALHLLNLQPLVRDLLGLASVRLLQVELFVLKFGDLLAEGLRVLPHLHFDHFDRLGQPGDLLLGLRILGLQFEEALFKLGCQTLVL